MTLHGSCVKQLHEFLWGASHCKSTRLWTFCRHEWWASVSRLYSKYHKYPEHSRIIHLGPLWIPWCMGWGCINWSWIRTLEFISPIRGHFCLRRTLSLGECHDPKSACLTFWSRFVVASVIPAIPERQTENLVILKPFWMLLSPEIMENEWKWMNIVITCNEQNQRIESLIYWTIWTPLADKRPAARHVQGHFYRYDPACLTLTQPRLELLQLRRKPGQGFVACFVQTWCFFHPHVNYMRKSLAKHSLSGLFLDYSWSVVWL